MNDIILEILSKIKNDVDIDSNTVYYIRSIANILLIDWSNKQLNRPYSSYDIAYSKASVLFYNAYTQS